MRERIFNGVLVLVSVRILRKYRFVGKENCMLQLSIRGKRKKLKCEREKTIFLVSRTNGLLIHKIRLGYPTPITRKFHSSIHKQPCQYKFVLHPLRPSEIPLTPKIKNRTLNPQSRSITLKGRGRHFANIVAILPY